MALLESKRPLCKHLRRVVWRYEMSNPTVISPLPVPTVTVKVARPERRSQKGAHITHSWGKYMRKFSLCLAVLLLFAVAAQAAPKAEIFGGYQYSRTEGAVSWSGWNGALTGNMGSFLGITADFSQVYKSGVHYSTYTFGPEVHAHLPLVKPFAHALFGGARLSGGGANINGFAGYFGGGIDAGSGLIGFRVAQFDWLYTRFSGVSSSKNVRLSSGIVLRF